ncbi:hypothetical protein IGB42_03950 [Andreprevotia sp. IGB-42]|uniref:type VI secretion system-associated FHA domain protein TagH n=1 Tax=Andreprevotia sp. IGB-42 TaxID=2497473 RepID=UPI00135B707F|nr:type VI secretion system-associated FHA domain protein TagH [Andreprevotia sp. IGB-42]KAF0811564.1 hypothetical protein IGB42_03950 [Andreprevotia sp. IGB-42]
MRLTILEYGGLPVSPSQSVVFSPPGATIGRSADNHMVLADETRQISRLQAAVRLDDSGCYLRNLSSVCAIEVNEGPLHGDQEHRLNPGDRISIGVYQLRVDDPAQTALPPVAEPIGVVVPLVAETASPAVTAQPASSVNIAQQEAQGPAQFSAQFAARSELLDAFADAGQIYSLPAGAAVLPPVADVAPMPPPANAAAQLLQPALQSEPAQPAAAEPFNLDGLFGAGTPASATAFAGFDVVAALPEFAPASASLPAVAPASLPPAAFWDSLVSEFAPVEQQAQFDQPAAIVAPLAPAVEAPPVAPPTTHALADMQALPVDPLDLFAAMPGDGASSLFADGAGVFAEAAPSPLGLITAAQHLPVQTDNVPEVASHFSLPAVAPAQPAAAAPDGYAGGYIAATPAPVSIPAPIAVAAMVAPAVAPLPPAGVITQAVTPTPGNIPRAADTGLPAGPNGAAADWAQQAPQLLGAFLEGAGLAASPATLNEAQFRQAGRMLAGFIGGAMDLLSSRTIIKREVKADLTMILDRENNPLKLLPDAQTVLKQMFGPPFPGFMSPEQAMDDAFHDLHAHQIGMLAGMRAALNQLLHDVSPDLIAQKTVAGSWYERMLPPGKEGRAWLQYRALHQSMVNAVEEDFQSVFGNAFLAAYDAEVELYRQHSKESARC